MTRNRVICGVCLDSATTVEESDLQALQTELMRAVRKHEGKLDAAGPASQERAAKTLEDEAFAWFEDIDELEKDTRTELAALAEK